MFFGYTFSEMLVLTNAFLMALVAILIGGVAVFAFDVLRNSNVSKSSEEPVQESEKKKVSV